MINFRLRSIDSSFFSAKKLRFFSSCQEQRVNTVAVFWRRRKKKTSGGRRERKEEVKPGMGRWFWGEGIEKREETPTNSSVKES